MKRCAIYFYFQFGFNKPALCFKSEIFFVC